MAATSTREIPSGMEYAQHEKTYAGFLHLLKWFIVHLAIIMVALYCLIIAEAQLLGAALLLLAVLALGYGIARTPSARRNAEPHPETH